MKTFSEFLDENKSYSDNDWVLVQNRKVVKYVKNPKNNKAPNNFTSSDNQEMIRISKAKKMGIIKEDISTTTVGGASIFTPIKPTGKAFGYDFFEVDCDSFEKCRKHPKKKYKHWMKLLGNKDIQQYAKQNKGSFLIK